MLFFYCESNWFLEKTKVFLKFVIPLLPLINIGIFLANLEVLWKEHINQARESEKINTDLEKECHPSEVGECSHVEEKKEEKRFLLSSMTRFYSIINNFFIYLIRVYQISISPFFGSTCKYCPSCSQYAIDTLKIYNPLKSSFYIVSRIIRCNPFSEGGYDPVGEKQHGS